MKIGFHIVDVAGFRAGIPAIALLLCLSSVVAAQGPGQTGVDAQREAMRKLSFLAGTWTGPVTVVRGPQPIHLTQTEQVEYKLDGLVMLIEGRSTDGRSTDGGGQSSFSALATVSYD